MSGNNVSRFLPGVVNFVWRDIKISFDSIFCNFIHIFHFLNQFFVLRQGKKDMICEQYLIVSCIVLLYRTSTWSHAVRKDDFSSATDIPIVLKHRQSNRFPVVGDAFNLSSN